MERSRDELRIKLDRPRCPFCHDDVVRGQDVAVCRDCDAKHHEDCWPEGGACGTCGGGVALRAAPAHRTATTTWQAAVTREQGSSPPELGAHRRLLEVVAELKTQRASSVFRNEIVLLLVCVPIFWPALLIGYFTERARTRALLREAWSLVRRHDLEVGREDLLVLHEAEAWVGT